VFNRCDTEANWTARFSDSHHWNDLNKGVLTRRLIGQGIRRELSHQVAHSDRGDFLRLFQAATKDVPLWEKRLSARCSCLDRLDRSSQIRSNGARNPTTSRYNCHENDPRMLNPFFNK